MTFDPNAAGFRWPTQQTLTRHLDGAQLTIAPSVVNFAGISRGDRQAECYRYYATAYGLFTELEISKWLAGGDSVCMDLLSANRNLFGTATELPLADVASALLAQGFTNQTSFINLMWLAEDGYAALEQRSGVPVIRRLRD